MANFISVEKLIEEAKVKGINFGKGDPYNRLRYYTKIGWLPNMKRIMDDDGNVKGHYPLWAVDRLVLIEQLKEKGMENDEISKKVATKNKFQNILTSFTDKESRTQLIVYTMLIMMLFVVSSEFGIIKVGKSKETYTNNLTNQLPNQILDGGTAFMPKNQNAVLIKTPLVKNNSKIYVAFTNNYAPATRYWSAEIKEYEGFVVETDTPVFNNSEFNWWITN
jgi:hypothetical protein